MEIRIQDITKHFAGFQALNGVDLDIADGELIALLGPSGSGKTTLLRIIAGLEFADAGRVLFGAEDMAARAVRERHVGFVFQHYALFKHMTRARQRELRAAHAAAPHAPRAGRDRGARRGTAGAGAARRSGRALPAPALGRPAPARGAGARAGDRAARAAARRALRRARRESAQGSAALAARAAPAHRHHHDIRDPRPGGGARAGRPRGDHESRAHRAGRQRERGLRTSCLALRVRVPRQHQHPAGDGRRAGAAHPGRRPAAHDATDPPRRPAGGLRAPGGPARGRGRRRTASASR